MQWAKYKDASDQCSFSRIWGGIHLPADDMPGRQLGSIIGPEAFHFENRFFSGEIQPQQIKIPTRLTIYPVPALASDMITAHLDAQVEAFRFQVLDSSGKILVQGRSDNSTFSNR